MVTMAPVCQNNEIGMIKRYSGTFETSFVDLDQTISMEKNSLHCLL